MWLLHGTTRGGRRALSSTVPMSLSLSRQAEASPRILAHLLARWGSLVKEIRGVP